MKRLLLIGIMVISGLCSRGQAGFAFWVAETVQPFHSESFSNFIESYNSYNANILDDGFNKKFKALKGLGWNVSFFMNDGYDFRANSGVSYLKSVNYAVMINGDRRKLDFRFKDLTVDMGIGGGSDGFFMNLNFGMNLRMSTLYASYVFANGFESIASDHKLNGIYDAWRLTGLLGATIGIPFSEYVQLIFRADYVFPAGKDETYRADYSDITEFKQSNDMNFPQNINTYVNDPYDLFNTAYNDFSGLRYTIGIQLAIGGEL